MLRKNFSHGFAHDDWDAAKAEARAILIDIARRGRTIAYSELVEQIPQIDLSAYDDRLFHFLGEIGEAESLAGRGILTATVVHKSADRSPGGGFYELAKHLGKNVSDRDRFWIEELERVSTYWRGATSRSAIAQGHELERLSIMIPEYPGSHPFSRSTNPKFYRRDELGDTAFGDTNRTRFFEKVLAGLYWSLGRAVPYAFITKSGEVRSLDAGCVKFLLNRQPPQIRLVCDPVGAIIAVEPTDALLGAYQERRTKLVSQVSPEEALLPLDFDLDAPVDERRRVLSEQIIRDGAASFRATVLSAWENRCAITKTKVEAVLDAAHIFRYLGPKTNDVRNGMPLRTDIHRLFDLHLLTIVPNEGGARVSISKMLGTTIYRKLDQALVTFPRNASFAPDFRILEYHAQAFRLAEAARM
jgi:hypothetical protein